MKFHEKLIDLRKKAGLSQEELGNRIGVSRQTVSKWELGQSCPDVQRLIALSDFFDVSLDQLVKHPGTADNRESCCPIQEDPDLHRNHPNAWKAINCILNAFAVFGAAGILLLLLIIFIWG